MPDEGILRIASRRSDGNLDITFTDTGTGMTRETLENLWRPLFTTKAKGMGFGLAISKRLVEEHGGSISVKSKPGKGSTFTVTLPINAIERVVAEGRQRTRTPSSRNLSQQRLYRTL
jgi:signal transduction histidine kinase